MRRQKLNSLSFTLPLATIVVISRQTYRKGMDLLVAVVPRICRKYSKVRFVIGGDGPKRIDLEQMREKNLLHDRVELLGSVKAHEVRNVRKRDNTLWQKGEKTIILFLLTLPFFCPLDTCTRTNLFEY